MASAGPAPAAPRPSCAEDSRAGPAQEVGSQWKKAEGRSHLPLTLLGMQDSCVLLHFNVPCGFIGRTSFSSALRRAGSRSRCRALPGETTAPGVPRGASQAGGGRQRLSPSWALAELGSPGAGAVPTLSCPSGRCHGVEAGSPLPPR